jgi:hypothetical protein
MVTEKILELAQRLVDRLKADIPLARTRDEHVRVSARANEADELLIELKNEYHISTVKNSTFDGNFS